MITGPKWDTYDMAPFWHQCQNRASHTGTSANMGRVPIWGYIIVDQNCEWMTLVHMYLGPNDFKDD